MDTNTAFSLILTIIGATIAVLGLLFKISEKLSRIQENTGKIEDVRTEVTKLSTGVDVVIRYGLQIPKGTIELNLPNLGGVAVSARPGPQSTIYTMTFKQAHHILDSTYISKKTRELGFNQTEITAFGREISVATYGSTILVATLPSTDASVCSKFVSDFLRFLDSLVEQLANELKRYEDIRL